MKKFLVCLLVLAANAALAQELTGAWSGTLNLPQGKLRIVFNINKTESGYSATMDSPDQNAKGIPVDKVTYEASALSIEMAKLGASYQGTYDATTNLFKGEFKQMGYKFPLDLAAGIAEKPKLNRPQEPKEPFPYKQQEVTFANAKDTVTLAGTLTIPEGKGPFTAVVMVTGSGPQDRNEELMGHKPFLVIADYLTRNGIAVLRYDDRGVGKSTGKFSKATTLDFANDANAAVAFLKTNKSINPKKIGIIGHSEGGMITVIDAVRNKDVAFIVSLAGTALRGDEILMRQSELLSRAQKVDEKDIAEAAKINRTVYDIVLNEKDAAKMRTDITTILKSEIGKQAETKNLPKEDAEKMVESQVKQITSPWFINFMRYNPQDDLAKLKKPMLYLVGEKDYQVPAEPNVAALKAIIEKGKKKNITINVIPGANHLFQQCKECTVSEYATLEETFSTKALQLMAEWINKR
jgi:Dienelactone hydrolase and related enzymes